MQLISHNQFRFNEKEFTCGKLHRSACSMVTMAPTLSKPCGTGTPSTIPCNSANDKSPEIGSANLEMIEVGTDRPDAEGLHMCRFLATSMLVLGFSIVPVSLAHGSALIFEVQHALKSKGYEPGAVDGIYGPKTVTAVRDFQKKSDLPIDGLLSPQTLAALGVTNAGAERQFHTAGTNVKRSYSSGGKQIGEAGKNLGSDIRDGAVVDGAKQFGKEVGQGAASIGRGTAHAAANASKGMKDAVTGNK
jgi:hypothetical protein